MKIAGISLTYNDEYKLNEWRGHYEEYKNDLDYFIIVDNGSEDKYISKLEKVFGEDALIIKREKNGGCTGAYNDGIKYAMKNTDADAIVIIANDIRLSKGCLRELYNYLYSDNTLGLVSAIMLLRDSDIIEDFGHKVETLKIHFLDCGKKYSDIVREERYTDLVSGGFNMAKLEFYEKVGLQDENLFMYGDELDMSIRSKQAGYKIGITSKVFVWHWHIDDPLINTRRPAVNYLIARNRVYLARKHFGNRKVFSAFFTFGLKQSLFFLFAGIIKQDKIRLQKAMYCFMGGVNGFRGDMRLNKYTKF